MARRSRGLMRRGSRVAYPVMPHIQGVSWAPVSGRPPSGRGGTAALRYFNVLVGPFLLEGSRDVGVEIIATAGDPRRLQLADRRIEGVLIGVRGAQLDIG